MWHQLQQLYIVEPTWFESKGRCVTKVLRFWEKVLVISAGMIHTLEDKQRVMSLYEKHTPEWYKQKRVSVLLYYISVLSRPISFHQETNQGNKSPALLGQFHISHFTLCPI